MKVYNTVARWPEILQNNSKGSAKNDKKSLLTEEF